jgi:ureidoglycolate hydrolase
LKVEDISVTAAITVSGKESITAKSYKAHCMHSSLLVFGEVTEFHATDVHTILGLTTETYTINKPPRVENEKYYKQNTKA